MGWYSRRCRMSNQSWGGIHFFVIFGVHFVIELLTMTIVRNPGVAYMRGHRWMALASSNVDGYYLQSCVRS